MSETFRHRSVAVAVIYDQPSQKFLLWHNKRWHGYAFPMKHFEPTAGVDPAQVALNALDAREIQLNLPNATSTPIDRHGECEFSEGVRQFTYYDYHVFGIDPGPGIASASLHPDLRWFAFDDLVAAPNVTWSTKSVARSLVEDRKVAVAVIARPMPTGTEFLLVYNRNHGYFFPATRMKTDTLPGQAVVQAVRNDLAYDGEIQVVDQSEVPDLQQSQRFGPRTGRFHFHLCLVRFSDDVDLGAPGNALEQSVSTLQAALAGRGVPASAAPYWGWFSESDLRIRTDMSQSVELVLATVLQLVERNR